MTSVSGYPYNRKQKTSLLFNTPFFLAAFLLCVQSFAFYCVWTSRELATNLDDLEQPGPVRRTTHDETNVPIPRHQDGTLMSQEERLRYLEMKLNAFMNFGSDPFFGSTVQSKCHKISDLSEYGCLPGMEEYEPPDCDGSYDHSICLDHLPPPKSNDDTGNPGSEQQQDPPCLVYDFGIRENPAFGATMARKFGCEVHAFDPSPVSTSWWKSENADALRSLTNYHFHDYGAAGKDGNITLQEYNWGQVSIIRYPTTMIDCSKAKPQDENCEEVDGPIVQGSFTLDVKTLSTIRKELGHEGRRIDVLKLDVEGSEYSFLENMLDAHAGCPDFIEQLTLEWHHMPWDPRYGEGSSPSINAITTLMHACGLKMFWQYSPGGWPNSMQSYQKMGMKDVRYNLASFHRTRE